MPFPELNDNRFEKNLTSGAHSYREKVREQILQTPRSGRLNRRSIDLTITNESTVYRPSSRRSYDALGFEQPRLKSASRDRQLIRYSNYVPSQESRKQSLKITEDPYLDKEFIGRPSSRESLYNEKATLSVRSSKRLPKSMDEHTQISSGDNLENSLTKSINFFEFDSSKSKTEQPPVPKPRQKDSILFNKQNLLLNENENLKIKRSTNSLNSSRAITPRFEHSRVKRYSTSDKIADDGKFDDSLRDNWLQSGTKTNLNFSAKNSSFDSNEDNKKFIYKRK